ncbi:MAG: RluA family pseudouridine synthase [Pseudomonadota bacterium]|nr:RluA family pseudouridine synthase [Pseudomonadota bacterium]
MNGVQRHTVLADEEGQRIDRWLKLHYPDLPRGRLQKLLRTGQIRVDGKRVKAGRNLGVGQEIRIPPIRSELKVSEYIERPVEQSDFQFLRGRVLYKDNDLIGFDKPAGLAVQGGSRTTRHLDGMLDALRFDSVERPKLVHRLDKDTSGVMVLARNRASARRLGQAFASRDVRKIYWALVVGVPKRVKGRINLPLMKGGGAGHNRVRVDVEGKRAVTDFYVVERAGSRLSWLALWPRTGRTHQIRAHCAAIGTPILGDGKYGGRAAFVDALPTAARQLQLLAREVILPKISGQGEIRIVAAMPPHMDEFWRMFELEPEATSDPFTELD